MNPGVGHDGKPSTNSAQNLGTSSPRSDRCARPLSTPCSSGPGNGWQDYLLTSGSRFAPSTNSTRAIAPLAGELRACIDVHGRRRRRGAAVADVGDAAAGGIVAGHYLPTPPGSPRLPGVDAPPSPTPSSRWSGSKQRREHTAGHGHREHRGHGAAAVVGTDGDRGRHPDGGARHLHHQPGPAQGAGAAPVLRTVVRDRRSKRRRVPPSVQLAVLPDPRSNVYHRRRLRRRSRRRSGR